MAVTYGDSRDHRADLTQWMLAFVPTHDGEVPLCLRPLDGKSSETSSLSATGTHVLEHLRASQPAEHTEPVAVCERAGSSQATMKASNEAHIRWCSRVPDTSTEAKAALASEPEQWQECSDQRGSSVSQRHLLPQGEERWMMIRTTENLHAARRHLQKKASTAQALWEKRLWHLSTESFACQQDADAAWQKAINKRPPWLHMERTLESSPRYGNAGRPPAKTQPVGTTWTSVPTVQLDPLVFERTADQQARFLLATTELSAETLSDEALLAVSTEQGGGERGVRFFNDPLFLASSVVVKKPRRLLALSFLLVLCLLVYRLAERRLRQRVQESEHTLPHQITTPTATPTMRWVFHCVEGIELLHMRGGSPVQTRIVRVLPLHHNILRLLGPPSQPCSFFSDEKLRNVGCLGLFAAVPAEAELAALPAVSAASLDQGISFSLLLSVHK